MKSKRARAAVRHTGKRRPQCVRDRNVNPTATREIAVNSPTFGNAQLNYEVD